MALTTMPFGKNKGTAFTALDASYINWLLQQDYLRPELRACLTGELERRSSHPETPAKKGLGPCPDVRTARRIIEAGGTALCQDFTDEESIAPTWRWLRAVVDRSAQS